MTRMIAAIFAALLVLAAPARAGYREARASFDGLPAQDRATVVIALIASGDFEALAGQGLSQHLYQSLRDFEQREGFIDDAIIDREQMQRLAAVAEDFKNRIGARYYDHPEADARLLVPRRLFDGEKQTDRGLLFTRRDGALSLAFVSYPSSEKSYDMLWEELSRQSGEKQIIYERRFASRFVVTGQFHGSKFYTMMARSARGTTGFTFSWGAPFEELGRKVSTFLANAWMAELR